MFLIEIEVLHTCSRVYMNYEGRFLQVSQPNKMNILQWNRLSDLQFIQHSKSLRIKILSDYPKPQILIRQHFLKLRCKFQPFFKTSSFSYESVLDLES